MKKFVIAVLLFFACFTVFAQEGVFFGFGAEANGNTREGAAIGGSVSFGFNINRYLALGYKTAFSTNLDTVSVLDHLGLLRWYLPLPKQGLFLQGEIGISAFYEDGQSKPVFLGAAAAGWRFLVGKNFYIEPVVRGGHPFAWGAGITFGYCGIGRPSADVEQVTINR